MMARIMARICNYWRKYPTVIISPHPKKKRNTHSPPRRGGVPARRNDGVVTFHFHIID